MDIEVVIPVLDNDKAAGSALDPSSVYVITEPQNGTVTVNDDGTITYLPNDSYVGNDFFTYIVKDIDGFTSAVTRVDVTVVDNQLIIPNVFTPNGDGFNDVFEISGLDSYNKAEIIIYNRWGNEVYKSNSYANDWDGSDLNEGTYYYVIKLEKRGKSSVYNGWVLLKRD
jgi:adhesin/invasin